MKFLFNKTLVIIFHLIQTWLACLGIGTCLLIEERYDRLFTSEINNIALLLKCLQLLLHAYVTYIHVDHKIYKYSSG